MLLIITTIYSAAEWMNLKRNLSLRFLTLLQYDGGESNLICGAHGIEHLY